MAFAVDALAQAVSTTTVQGTVYLANGSPGSGILQLSWPAFTTASSQAITAGKVTAAIGADGFVSVNLAPNLGSTPAGLYYTAIYHLSDGTTSTEYWVIPAAAQATIAQVRSQVMPAAQAAQAVSKAYVDQAIQSVAQGNLTSTGGQLTGPLYLTGDPTQSLQASDKHYVDASFAQAVPMSGGAVNGPLTAQQLGAAYQVDQFSGVDFGAKLQACVSAINRNYGGTCDARNFSGTLAMASNVTISSANTTVMLPCATITTGSEIIVPAGIRNVSLRGCALRGASDGSGSQGGTVLLYSGASAAVQVGDPAYASNTLGFHLDNVVINTTPASRANAQALAAYRTQEIDLQSLYLLGNANQTGITLDGTGNYTGGTFYDNHISGFQTAIKGIGHQVTNSAATDWLNASAFVRLHIDCPTSGGNPIAGTYGVNLEQGDGNTFTGGDVENCGTALHLGANAQNNTIMGLRNENSTYQVVADPGSAYNSWITGGTMFTGKLTDNGTRNSFLDAFHRSFNSLNGDWYGSQQDATLTNHYRLGIGSGNERGLLDRYQTDGGYRWTMGLSDATGGAQFYQVLDELNGVYRLSIGQYNSGQASTNNQTVVNSAGTGAVILNGSNNAGTGGVVFGSGGANESTVATVSNTGNAQFNGTLQVGGTTQSTGTMTVRNNADSEVDYYLWPGLSNSQKGSFTYKDWNGNSQWYLVKDASNNWALNSAVGGLDSIKAYQSNNSGDTYINASNASGVVRVNYETGAGSAFNIYGGNSSNLYASFSGNTSIKFPGLSASSGRNCLQIDSAGFISNTGAACSSGGSGTVNNGSTGQIAYYNSGGTSISGINTIPVSAGGTGASTAVGALAALNGVSTSTTAPQSLAGPLNASINSQINVIAYGAKGDCATDDTAAFTAAQTAALTYQTGNSLPAALYLPKPPGGCYIVSNWTWKGVSLLGPATTGLAAASPYQSAVTLKSKPGQDVLHVPDPTYTTGTITVNPGWAIENISFLVDNSVAGSFPHRWPGRWFDDGAITSGSAVFTSANAHITCGDVGQAIQVNGAGAGGTNLVTTIASVSPCWIPSTQSGTNQWQVVTLATTASTAVTNAHSYISVLGLPVTENIGNCAIAFDMADGLRSNWVGTTAGGNYGRMDNVTFGTTNGQNNDVCGIFTQGNPYLYGVRVDNFAFYNQKFSVVQTASELNSFQESNAGDFQLWQHGLFFLPWNPWISINGLSNKLKHVQYNTKSGVQIMQLANSAYDSATGWDIDLGGEAPNGATVYGHRIDGNYETITGDFAVNGTSEVGYADVNNSTINGDVNNTQLNGFGNTVIAPNITTGVIDNGYANKVRWIYNGGGSPNGMPLNYWVCGTFCKGSSDLAGRFTPDFLLDGNFTTPYNHDDQLIMPKDVVLTAGGAYNQYIVTDSTAKSGVALMVSGSAPTSYYYAFMQYNELSNTLQGITVGTNFPTTGGMFYFSARCPTGSTFTAYAKASTVFSQSFSCTTRYQQYSIPMAFAGGDTGQPLQFGGSAGTNPFYLEWAAFVPRPNFPVGTTIGGAGVATGPSSGTAANDMVCYANTTGLMQDCNTATNPGITTAATNTFTIKSTGGGAQIAINASSTSYNAFLQWYYGATRYWNAGLNTGGTSWVLNDYQNAHNVISFPNNTMPANSIGGNANGATAITQAASDNSTNIATDAFVKANLPLSGTTASIGGSALALGACASGTVNVTGATNSMAVVATPATYPGDGMVWRPYVSSAGVVTVKVCAAVAGTPVASTYIVRVIP